MPGVNQHLRAAAENRALAESLYLSVHPGWGAVLAFYSALHLVDAFLATKDVHPESHRDREAAISRVSELRAIYPDYRALQNRSNDVRYRLKRLRSQEVRDLIDHELAAIESLIKRLLGPATNETADP
jgi:uncharacterized protein (UPF0332 family)